ncbi:MAG: DUF2721 domain-containing protein [Pseudomonadota bacterium]
MDLTLTVPALLFPTVSLLLIAYTTRFLALANLIRGLKIKYTQDHNPNYIQQINSLRKRVVLIRNMQAFGIASLFFSVATMILIFVGEELYGKFSFGFALLLMLLSLGISFRETLMQGVALNLELEDIEKELKISES